MMIAARLAGGNLFFFFFGCGLVWCWVMGYGGLGFGGGVVGWVCELEGGSGGVCFGL